MAEQTGTGTEYIYPSSWSTNTANAANYASAMPGYANKVYKNWYTEQPLTAATNSNLSAALTDLRGTNPYAANLNQAVTGAQSFQPYQNQAASALGTWNTAVPGAQNTLGQAASPLAQMGSALGTAGQNIQNSAFYDPNEMQQFLNPYVTNVVDANTAQSNKNLFNTVIPGVNSTFAGTGQFGSSRNADFMNRAVSDQQQNLMNTNANVMMNAQNQAQSQYADWANRGLTAGQNMTSLGQQYGNQSNLQQQLGMNQAAINAQYGDISSKYAALGQNQLTGATTLGNLANAGSAMYQQGLTNKMTAGQTQQQMEQARLDKNYQDWLTQQQYPLTAMGAMGSFIGDAAKGVQPNTFTPMQQPDDITRMLAALQAMNSGLNATSIQNLLGTIGLTGTGAAK